MSLTAPPNNAVPFAQSGLKNTIPTTTGSDEVASMSAGFPPKTMTPLNAGGVPPAGRDMNGILNQLSSHQVWLNAGMIYKYDSTLATAIGGYKIGAIIQTDDGLSAYVCVDDDNMNNPNSVVTGWLPWAGQALLNAGKLAMYDVDDIYQTTKVFADGAAVAAYFGGGTWVTYGGGTHPSFAGTSDGVTLVGNTVSGSHTHTITIDEVPAHNHANGIYKHLVAKADDALASSEVWSTEISVNALNNLALDNEIQVAGFSDKPDSLTEIKEVGGGQPMPIRPRTTTYFAWLRTA